MALPDRLQELLDQSQVTGIDFIYVHEDQVTLDIYFHLDPGSLDDPLVNDLQKEQIQITALTKATSNTPIPVDSLFWETVDSEIVCRIIANRPGDFTNYRLFIDDPRIDDYFNRIPFTFKANCRSDLDCKPQDRDCPPNDIVDFPIDYLARDFESYRRALFDFASQRYPDWQERLEADAAVMLMEVMASVADEMSYYQDRVAREAYLESATQRRSVRHHARLVDYHPRDAIGAQSWIDITVKSGESGTILAGTAVWSPSNQQEPLYFEIGSGLQDALDEIDYAVDSALNQFQPHIWDEDDTCLSTGSTQMAILGHHEADIAFDNNSPNGSAGKWMLLKSEPTEADIPRRRHLIRVTSVTDDHDPVLDQDITIIEWQNDQALPFEVDLEVLQVRGNILPVTSGHTRTAYFSIGELDSSITVPSTIETDLQTALQRRGHDGISAYLFSLIDSAEIPLTWLFDQNTELADPEIHLVEGHFEGNDWKTDSEWNWRRSYLGTDSSLPYDNHFTLEDGTWDRVVGYQRVGKEIVHRDYKSGDGFTVRFGDGEFGRIPSTGSLFQVKYRTGAGKLYNIPEGAITEFDQRFSFVESVSNPLPATDGTDPETPEKIRQLAPEAFRSKTYRAVRPVDYEEAAEGLDWVQSAGAKFRWTGSWLTAFVTPDPMDENFLSETNRASLENQLDRFRQAGRDTAVPDPQYASLDLEITLCLEAGSFWGEVKEQALEALFGTSGYYPKSGFFDPDNFTFGTPLRRYSLEAALQNVAGVKAVDGILYRRRGWFDWKEFTDANSDPGIDNIIRIANDPLRPEWGSVKLYQRNEV